MESNQLQSVHREDHFGEVVLLIEEDLRGREEHHLIERVSLNVKPVDANVHLKSELVFEVIQLLQLCEAMQLTHQQVLD